MNAATAPRSPYLIGVDGGGTRTRARLADPQGRLLGLGEAGPSGLSQGVSPAWVQVQLAIARAFADAGLPVADPALCALSLGLAGARSESLAAAFRAAAPGFVMLRLDTDAATTLHGAHGGAPGAVVAVGTGSVGLAKFADDRVRLIGGWGFGVGDEGSGGWLGLRAMQQAQRVLDGRACTGALAQAVWRSVGETASGPLALAAGDVLATMADSRFEAMAYRQRTLIAAWCAGAGAGRYATLAPLVFDSAAVDTVAARLLQRAAAELAAIAEALDPNGALPLAVTGSIGQRLAAQLPPALRARCVAPAGDSAQGALQALMADLAGRDNTAGSTTSATLRAIGPAKFEPVKPLR